MLGIVSEDNRAAAGTMGKINIYRDSAEALLKLKAGYDLQPM
jgi:hypothetical protein